MQLSQFHPHIHRCPWSCAVSRALAEEHSYCAEVHLSHRLDVCSVTQPLPLGSWSPCRKGKSWHPCNLSWPSQLHAGVKCVTQGLCSVCSMHVPPDPTQQFVLQWVVSIKILLSMVMEHLLLLKQCSFCAPRGTQGCVHSDELLLLLYLHLFLQRLASSSLQGFFPSNILMLIQFVQLK